MSAQRIGYRLKGCRAAAGHTLLELIIALAVLSTTLIIAAELLLARERQMARAGKTLKRMDVEVALQQLRRDILRTRAQPSADALAAGAPLELLQTDGGAITWRREDDRLLRRRVDGSGDLGERPMIDGVSDWRWQLISAGERLRPMVEAEITLRPTGRPIGIGAVGEAPIADDVRRLIVALRAIGGRAW